MNDFILSKATYFYYSRLNSIEKEWYKIFLGKLINFQNVVELNNEITANQITTISKALLNDRPDIFWYNGSYTTTTRNGMIIRITFEFKYSTIQIENVISQIQNSFLYKTIETKMPHIKSDFEKALFLYEIIIKNAEYEERALSISGSTYDYAYGMEGIFIKSKAVCAGYSKAFQYFANRNDINCTIVTGTTRRSRHAWNLINLYGDYYYIDATWGDPTFSSAESKPADYISYDYFCITTDELYKSHQPQFDEPMPMCTATKYNYYRYFGLIEEYYTVESVAKHIINAKKQNKCEMTIKYATESSYRNAVMGLFNNSEIFEALKIASRYCKLDTTSSVSYQKDDVKRLITLKI